MGQTVRISQNPRSLYLTQSSQDVIGDKGSGPGQLDQPRDMLYVTDSGNHRVCVFDQHGTYLRVFGRKSNTVSIRVSR